MNIHKPTLTEQEYIRYWHPRKGGWYQAKLVRLGRKWATLQDYWPGSNPRRYRVPVANVKAAL